MNITDRLADRGIIVLEVRHRDPLLKAGVVATLREDVRFRVQSDDHLGMAATLDADVVITDYETGIALAESPGRRGRARRVMIVTQRDGETDVRHALSRGVLGYVVMGCRLDEIADCAMAVQRGQRYLTQAAAVRIAEHLLYQSLTPREIDVLHCVAGGWTNKMVGNHLGMGVGTVKAHLKAIFSKLDVRTRTEAAHVAQRRGLLPALQIPVSNRSSPPAQCVAVDRVNAHGRPAVRLLSGGPGRGSAPERQNASEPVGSTGLGSRTGVQADIARFRLGRWPRHKTKAKDSTLRSPACSPEGEDSSPPG